MFVVLRRSGDDTVEAHSIDAEGDGVSVEVLPLRRLSAFVTERERERPRWVWDDTARWYPDLLRRGVRVERAHDLRLCHAILRNSPHTASSELAAAPEGPWDGLQAPEVPADVLFDSADPQSLPDPVAEFALQRRALAGAPGGLRLLLAAESSGALAAAEMGFAGLPWRVDVHDRILRGVLGDRPMPGDRPARMGELLVRMRAEFGVPDLNPDSPAELLRGLRRAGLTAGSTRSAELSRIEHPGIPALLEYKKLARLASANGWQWLDDWVRDGRFHPLYVPGGVVTGRWASSGGGALQLPAQVRPAVVADPGWKLVAADAAQLEPRVLAGLARDQAMAAAARGGDLYAGMVAAGAVQTREQAKYGMLGAMYGGTSGESGRMVPRLARAYPRALALVEQAARVGERGGQVASLLGRGSPAAGSDAVDGAPGEGVAPAGDGGGRARARGRFTRNFVVQSTAAEWALCWIAGLRNGLWRLGAAGADTGARNPLLAMPHLVFFLHDEVLVHTPADRAEEVVELVRATAAEAGRLVFGDFPIDFPVTADIVDDYSQAG